jgi:hypothetical protein
MQFPRLDRDSVLIVTSLWPPAPGGWEVQSVASDLSTDHRVAVAILDAAPDRSRTSGPNTGSRGAAYEVRRFDSWHALALAMRTGELQSELTIFAGALDADEVRVLAEDHRSVLLPLVGVRASYLGNLGRLLRNTNDVICLSPSEFELVQQYRGGRGRTVLVRSIVPTVAPGPPAARITALQHRGPIALAVVPATLDSRFDELIANWCAFRDRPRTRYRSLVLVGARRSLVPKRGDVFTVPGATITVIRTHLAVATYLVIPWHEAPAQTLLAEAWRQRVPVLVSGGNLTAARDTIASGGGLVYTTTEDFIHQANALAADGTAYGTAGEAWTLPREALPLRDGLWGVTSSLGSDRRRL